MAHVTSTVPAPAMRGVASGVLFMAFFGTLWAGIGIGGLQGLGDPWLPLAVVLVGLGLLGAGMSLLRAARGLAPQAPEATAQPGRRVGLWFGLTFATEGLLIFIASAACNALDRRDLFFPIMAIIVGIHFLPLAALFELRSYYLVGALFCALALITLLAVPAAATLGGRPILLQSVVLGFGAALILWSVGLGLWRLGSNLLKH